MSNEDEFKRPKLSFNFKIKMVLVVGIVIMTLVAFLAYVSIQGCPAYFLNFPMRTVDCDVSNVLTMTIELTVAGIFAIILGLIFYEKQKGDSDVIIELNKKQLEQKGKLETVDKKLDAVNFEIKRLNGIRVLKRNFEELGQVFERIKPNDEKGPFRNTEDLEKKDELISKIENVIDNISLSKDIKYELPVVISTLIRDAKNVPPLEQISKTSAGKFIPQDNPEFDNIISRITKMKSTLDGIEGKIIEKNKEE